MEEHILIAKVTAWATGSAAGIFGAGSTGEVPIIALTIGAVLTFAGLLVRQILVAQGRLTTIIDQKDSDILDLRIRIDVMEWREQRERFLHGEGPDPGVYVMRADLSSAQAKRAGRPVDLEKHPDGEDMEQSA